MLMIGFRDPPTLPLYVYRTSRDYDSRQTAHGGRARQAQGRRAFHCSSAVAIRA